MQLWRLDIVGGVFFAIGRECKLITGIDDHSRCVLIGKWSSSPPAEVLFERICREKGISQRPTKRRSPTPLENRTVAQSLASGAPRPRHPVREPRSRPSTSPGQLSHAIDRLGSDNPDVQTGAAPPGHIDDLRRPARPRLCGVNLRGANLIDADLTGVIADESTIWP
jgi:hypothetical protein